MKKLKFLLPLISIIALTINVFAGNCPDATITVSITTDDYPDETTWQLVDQNSQAVIAFEDLSGLLDFTTYSWDVCVSANGCYDFTIFDSFGDGICCAEGNGSYTVFFNGATFGSGGAFLAQETQSNIGGCGIINPGGCTTSCAGGPPPANDACSGATNLGQLTAPDPCTLGTGGTGTPQTFQGTNICATAEFPYTSITGCQTGGDMASPAADVWYTFSITGTVLDVAVTSQMAGISLGLWVDQGQGCGNLLARGCAENQTGGAVNASFTSLNPGTYYLQVSGRDTLDQCDFSLTLTNSTDCEACILQNNLIASPAPVNGNYQSGTTVTFTYVVQDYNQTASNWIHGIVPVFGSGWDLSTLTSQVPPPSCSADGSWAWYNSPVTGTSGSVVQTTSAGPGFFYESTAGCPLTCDPSNPGDNYGDQNVSPACQLTFSWTISTKASCPPGFDGENLSIEVFNYGDSETGSWTSPACELDPNLLFLSTLFCCDSMILTTTDVTCPGNQDGSATVQGQGEMPWDYELQDAFGNTIQTITDDSSDYIFSGLAGGTYTMIVTDFNLCSDIRQFVIEEPDPISISGSVTDAICFDGNNGAIDITVNGGTPGYSYIWSDNNTNEDRSGLSAETYGVTVTDANSCSATASFTVNEPAPIPVTNNTAEICDGESIFIGGDFQTVSGSYSDTLSSVDGCDSIVITDLIVNPIALTVINVGICEGESYLAGGALQTQSGTYFDTLLTSNACDSIIVTDLTVNPIGFTSIDPQICEGDSFFAGGQFQTFTGIYYDTLTTSEGCDSVIETNLVVLDAFNVNRTVEICDDESFFVGGATQTQPGEYVDTLSTVSGCDSIITTTLIVNPTYVTNVVVAICDGESYFVGGADQDVSGIYYDTLSTVNNCDSVIETILTVNPNSSTIIDAEICYGETYLAAGVLQNQAGTYFDTLSNNNGCDSVITTNLVINPTETTSVDVAICDGDSVFIGGSFQTQPGVYFDTLATSEGCDSIIVTTLMNNGGPTLAFSADTVCFGEATTLVNLSVDVDPNATYYIDFLSDGSYEITATASDFSIDTSFVLNAAGTYPFTAIVVNPAGCSDTLSSAIVVNDLPELGLSFDTVCVGSATHLVDLSTGIDAGATYYIDFLSDGSYDIVAPAVDFPSDTFVVFAAAGTFPFTAVVQNGNGCTDTLVSAILVNDLPELGLSFDTVCVGSATHLVDLSTGIDQGAMYYIDFLSDSSYDIVAPAADFPSDTFVVFSGAGSFPFTAVVENGNGCTDTLISAVVVNDNPVLDFSATTVCNGEPTTITNLSTGVDAGATYYLDLENDGNIDFTAPSVALPTDSSFTLTNSGSFEFRAIVVNSTGCSDTLVASITVLENSDPTNVLAEICEGESYFVGGALQTQAGQYFDTLSNADGCDSVIITDLTVIPSSRSTVQVTICDGESFFAGGVDQTATGTYYDTLTAASGCDSIIATELTVTDPLSIDFNAQNISCGCSVDAGNTGDEMCTLNFAGLPHGTIIEDYFEILGITVTGVANDNNPNDLVVFNTDLQWTADPDLEVGAGNAIIFPTYTTDNDNDGLVDNPNDQGVGGVITFEFDEERTVYAITFIDNDRNGGTVTGYDANNNVVGTINAPSIGDGTIQELNLNFNNVKRLVVEYEDSRAVTGLVVDCNACPLATDGAAHGEIITNQLSSQGITVTGDAVGNFYPDQVIIFNSDLTGTADADLEVGVGNIFILPENMIDLDGDGFIDSPDDNPVGGTITFDFDRDRTVYSLDIIDNDRNDGTVTAYDEFGGVILSVTTPSIGQATVQTVTLNATGVRKVVVAYNDSRGIGNLLLDCEEECCDGSILASGLGGTAPYTYVWSTGETVNSLDSLCEGTYVLTITDQLGCTFTDSVTIYTDSTGSITQDQVTICEGDSVFVGGAYQTEAGSYVDTLGVDAECIDVLITELIVEAAPRDTLQVEICEGDSVFAGGAFQTQSGFYEDQLTASNGCDSVAVTDLIVVPGSSSSEQLTICEGDSVLLEGSYQTTSGTYVDLLQGANGCDSTVSTTLTVTPANETIVQAEICDGDSLFVGGAFQTTAGNYTDVFAVADGCDSLVITELSVNDAVNGSTEVEICDGDSVFVGGAFQTIAGFYTDTLQASSGCDSILTTELIVLPTTSSTDEVEICAGDSVFVGGAFQTQAGFYDDVYVGANGCDSTVTTEVIILQPATSSDQVEICDGDSVFVGGAFQTLAGFYDDVFVAANGCDSIVTTEVIILQPATSNDQVEICGGDSVLVGGAFQTQAGFYDDIYVGANGCDSIVTTEVIVLPNPETTVDVEICAGDSVFVGGGFQNQSGTYTDVYIAANGCDSTVITNLTVSPTIGLSTSVTDVTCTGATDGEIDLTVTGGTLGFIYLWSNNAVTQDITGLLANSYSVTVTDALGCSATTSATVNQPAPLALGATTVPASCQGGSDGSIDLVVLGGTPPYTYLWTPTGDTTQDVSGLPAGAYSVLVTDANGCEANVIVNVQQPQSIQLSAVITDDSGPIAPTGAIDLSVIGGTSPYTYLWSNSATTQDLTGLSGGAYTVTVTDDNGCTAVDSFVVNGLIPRLASGIEDQDALFEVKVYPNPFQHHLTVELEAGIKENVVISLYNIIGKEVLSTEITVYPGLTKHQLEITPSVVSGVYLMEVRAENGEKRLVKTLIRD